MPENLDRRPEILSFDHPDSLSMADVVASGICFHG